MDDHDNAFDEGDRVRAWRRENFPQGTLLKRLDAQYWLVQWDTDKLETAHCSELARIDDASKL